MTKEKYLDSIRKRLNLGYRQYDVVDIVEDYDSMFEDMRKEGKSDAEIVSILGKPNQVVASLLAQKKPDYTVGVMKMIEWGVYLALLFIFLHFNIQFGGSIVSYVVAVSIPISLWYIEDRSYATKKMDTSAWKYHLVVVLIFILISIYNFTLLNLKPWEYIPNYGIWHCYLLYISILLSLGSLYKALRQASLEHYFTFPILFLYVGFGIQYIGFIEVMHRLDDVNTFLRSNFIVTLPLFLSFAIFFFLQIERVQKWMRK